MCEQRSWVRGTEASEEGHRVERGPAACVQGHPSCRTPHTHNGRTGCRYKRSSLEMRVRTECAVCVMCRGTVRGEKATPTRNRERSATALDFPPPHGRALVACDCERDVRHALEPQPPALHLPRSSPRPAARGRAGVARAASHGGRPCARSASRAPSSRRRSVLEG